MPSEPTQAKLKRRVSRKDLDEYGGLRFDTGHVREVEQKRIRGMGLAHNLPVYLLRMCRDRRSKLISRSVAERVLLTIIYYTFPDVD